MEGEADLPCRNLASLVAIEDVDRDQVATGCLANGFQQRLRGLIRRHPYREVSVDCRFSGNLPKAPTAGGNLQKRIQIHLQYRARNLDLVESRDFRVNFAHCTYRTPRSLNLRSSSGMQKRLDGLRAEGCHITQRGKKPFCNSQRFEKDRGDPWG